MLAHTNLAKARVEVNGSIRGHSIEGDIVVLLQSNQRIPSNRLEFVATQRLPLGTRKSASTLLIHRLHVERFKVVLELRACQSLD